MPTKLPGKLLAVSTFFVLAASAAGQEDAAKQKAIDQMRQIAKAVKQCPVQESRSESECKIHNYHLGPPTNVEWDVLPSRTARSPFQGILEFTLPSGSKDTDQPNLPKKVQQKCANREAAMAEADAPRLAEAMKEVPQWRDGHYRYEFDLGPGAPELIKILWVVKDKNNNTVTSADKGDAHACWIIAARSGGDSTKTENTSASPTP